MCSGPSSGGSGVCWRGVGDGDDGDGAADRWAEEAPVLAGLAAASVQGRVALGPRAGAGIRRCGNAPDFLLPSSSVRGPCHARANGFDLHAGVVVPGRDRARLERICRYALRPPVAHDRIQMTDDGQVRLELRHRWSDGTTHLVFDPIELLARLAALTPRPRINLVLYYGVLGAHAAWRSRLAGPAAVLRAPDTTRETPAGRPEATALLAPKATAAAMPVNRGSNLLWAQLMQRSFGFDVLACPRCGGRLRLLALIEDPRVIRRDPGSSQGGDRSARRTAVSCAAHAVRGRLPPRRGRPRRSVICHAQCPAGCHPRDGSEAVCPSSSLTCA